MTLDLNPLPDASTGHRCRWCRGFLWVWEPGPRYPITVCDSCFEVTFPAGFAMFDSGVDYFARADDLVRHLKARRLPGPRDMPGLGGGRSPLPDTLRALAALTAPAKAQ